MALEYMIDYLKVCLLLVINVGLRYHVQCIFTDVLLVYRAHMKISSLCRYDKQFPQPQQSEAS